MRNYITTDIITVYFSTGGLYLICTAFARTVYPVIKISLKIVIYIRRIFKSYYLCIAAFDNNLMART